MRDLMRILPPEFFSYAKDAENICEIRLRLNKPAVINRNGIKFATPFFVTKNNIDYVLMKASNASIYSVTESMAKGFITTQGGIRIGIGGRGVYKDGKISSIGDISSLNIRVPHEIKGAADNILPYITAKKRINNTLIFSLPGAGKTTLLRDICRNFNNGEDVLIIDERNELSGTVNGNCTLDVGNFSDLYVFLDKKTAFENGLRTMKPEIVVTDELNYDDFYFVKRAFSSGVVIIASFHADDIEEIKNICQAYKTFFDLYIRITAEDRRYATVYNERFKISDRVIL